jgi:hypothetical protein
MVLAFLAGIGGGAFSGFMPSTSYFFPGGMQGTALGLQAGSATSASRSCSCSRRTSSAWDAWRSSAAASR